MTDSRVLAVLFADLVDSTRLLVDLGARGVEVSNQLADRLAASTAEQGGVVTKELGDGLMATFPSAGAAIDAAVELQRQTWQLARDRDVPLELTIGISIGDLAPRGDGDWIGVPAVEAARLCSAARPGQILSTDTAVLLSRHEGESRSVGSLELKGLDAPVAATEIVWQPPTSNPVPVSGSLAVASEGEFVGRAGAMDQLLERWKSAQAGTGGVVLISGEPGIGKTRLAGELGVRAHDSGGIVVFGHCDEGKGIAYQPFVEATRFLLANTRAVAGRGLARLLPELARDGGTDTLDRELARIELFDAVRDLFVDSAAHTPLLVVLEDLHWATESTLAVLRHVLEVVPTHPILIALTYRSTEIDRVHPLGEVLADLRRGPDAVRIPLDGFSEQEVEDLLRSVAGHDLRPEGVEFAGVLRAETGGNVFFMREVLRHLVDSGALVQEDGEWTAADPGQWALPEGVRDVVGRRLSGLSEEANVILAIAAVVGRTFDARVVEMVHGASVVGAIEDAIAAGLVRESGRGVAFEFAHALVQETLLAELSALRTAKLHQGVAEAMAVLPHGDDSLVAIANHAIAAAAVMDGERIAELVYVAAETLSQSGALNETIGLLDRAEAVLEEVGTTPGPMLARLYSGLAMAYWWQGDRDRSLEFGMRAVELAREADDDNAFVTAVTAMQAASPFGMTPELFALLPEALLRAEPGSAEYIGLRGNQLMTATYFWNGEDLVRAARDLVAMARELDNHNTLQTALALGAFASLTAVDPNDCIEFAAEQLAGQTETHVMNEVSRIPMAWVALRLGNFDEAVRQSGHLVGLESPTMRALPHQVQAVVSMLRLELDLAELSTRAVLETSPDDVMYHAGCAAQAIMTSYLRDPSGDHTRQANEVASLVSGYAQFAPAFVGFFAARAGRMDEARERFEQAWAEGPASIPRDWTYVGTLHLLAELAADLGEAARARELDAALEPYGDQMVLAMCTHVPASVPFTRGRLAMCLGDRDRGVELLRRALAIEERADAPALARRTREVLDQT
jgi:class 3 adenylate cyclase/tetratricopeptide (TPR) repeat protein